MFFAIKRRAPILSGVFLTVFFGAVLCVSFPKALPVFRAAQAAAPVYVLDAGHGGEDGGAVSKGGVRESDINLAIVRDLDALLHFLGQDTVLTRSSDVSVHSDGAQTLREKKVSDLKNRVALVNATPGAVLVSIHQNSLPQAPSVHGAQVFYGKYERGDTLAASVQSALNRGVNVGNEKHEKPIEPTIYLMKNAACPAILVECGFLSNERETAMLRDTNHQKALAVAIASGLLNTEETEGNIP